MLGEWLVKPSNIEIKWIWDSIQNAGLTGRCWKSLELCLSHIVISNWIHDLVLPHLLLSVSKVMVLNTLYSLISYIWLVTKFYGFCFKYCRNIYCLKHFFPVFSSFIAITSIYLFFFCTLSFLNDLSFLLLQSLFIHNFFACKFHTFLS